MKEQAALEQRISDLEAHLAHQEGTLQDLSDITAKQWGTIDALASKVEMMKHRLAELEDAPQTGTPDDPPPPHF